MPLNLFLVCLVGIGLSVLLGLIAFAQIWRRGYAGAGSAAVGVLLPVALLAWPLTFVPAFLNLPPINDVTTDVANPPRFVALAKPRADTTSSAAYPGQRFAAEQLKAYPDLRTFVIDRSAQEAFELVEDAVRKLKWRIAVSDPPAVRPLKGGTIEATDNTLVVGFTDDIVIRVEGSVNRSRIDVRSASRHGQHDLGQNATRVRRFLAELQGRIDSTSAGGVAGRRGLRTTRAGAAVKKLKGRDQKKGRRSVATDESAFDQVLNVSEHRKRRRVEQLGVEALVDDGHDGAHGVGALADAIEDRMLAHAPVQQVGLDEALGVLDLAAVARKVGGVATHGQPLRASGCRRPCCPPAAPPRWCSSP